MPTPQRILAIETASEACSIALFERGEPIAHDHRVIGRGHAEQLVPMIAALPDKGKADRILVSLGPGSFTGIRIGIATARALGVAWGVEVLGYPTLTLLAAQAREEKTALVTVCINGGHGEWFVQNFADGQAEDEAQSLAPEDAKRACRHDLIVGNRAAELAAMFANGRHARDLLPDAQATVHLPDGALSNVLAPIYGRGPDATPIAERKAV